MPSQRPETKPASTGRGVFRQDFQEGRRHLGVEVLAGLLLQIGEDLLRRPGGAVRPVRGQGVPDVHDDEDAGRQGDGLPGQAPGG